MTLSLRRAHGLDDRLDRDHGLYRLGATTVIRVHMSGADLATRGDGISCRHREGPAVVAVVDRQIDLERSVDAFEIIWQPERQPERGATALRGSESRSKVNACFATSARPCSGSWGEIATSVAPRDSTCGRTACRAASSALQYGHHTPRKNVSTSGPRFSRSAERTSVPSWFMSPNVGI